MLKPEYLSEDILEEEYIKYFSPYHFIQKILGSCRVDARDRFVTVPSYNQKIYTIICTIVSAILFIFLNYCLYCRFNKNFNLFLMCLGVVAVMYVIYLCNMIQVRFLKCDENAKFFIQLQKLDRLMRIERNQHVNTFLQILNYTSMTLLILMYIIPTITLCYKDLNIGIGILGLFCTQIAFLTEIILCGNTIVWFFLRLRFLNCIIRNHLKSNIKNVTFTRINYPTKRRFRFLASKSHDFVSSPTDVYLKEILKAFDNFQLLFRYQIFLFFIKLIPVAFITFNIVLLILQTNDLELFFSIHVPFVSLIDTLLSTFLCVSCRIFFNEIKYTKRLSTNVMAVHLSGPLREKAKRMWTIIDNSPPQFSVYDMWKLDLFLLLQIFHIITTFIITRLQFAVL